MSRRLRAPVICVIRHRSPITQSRLFQGGADRRQPRPVDARAYLGRRLRLPRDLAGVDGGGRALRRLEARAHGGGVAARPRARRRRRSANRSGLRQASVESSSSSSSAASSSCASTIRFVWRAASSARSRHAAGSLSRSASDSMASGSQARASTAMRTSSLRPSRRGKIEEAHGLRGRGRALHRGARISGGCAEAPPHSCSTSNMREGSRFHEPARELLPHALRHERVDLAVFRHLAHEVQRLRGDGEGEARSEARHAQYAHRVFRERGAHVSQHAGLEIARAVERIDDAALARPSRAR